MADRIDQLIVDDGAGRDTKKRKIFLIVSACVLLVAVGVAAVLIFGNMAVSEDRVERILEFGKVTQGVTLGGVDLSDMTAEQAREATDNQENALMAQTKLSFDIGGAVTILDSAAIGLQTDYEDVLSEATQHGRSGSFDERLEEIAAAKNGQAEYEISITADEANVGTALLAHSTTFNNEAKDASYVFMPNGYLEDGTPYDPGNFDGKARDLSALVRLSNEEKPNPLRYQYWKKTKYIDDFIPPDADIARFLYSEEQRGLETDMDALKGLIISAVENGNFSTITVPTQVTEPKVTLEQVKAQTQLISSWTTWYGHSKVSNRAFNVGLLSSKINGLMLESEQEFSINKDIGARTVAGGFKRAGVLEGGRSTDDVGGGVCQVSSTLFNAALRSNITVLVHNRHTIPSAYLPIGLDAAISSPTPDLIIKNSHDTPVFIVAYMDHKNKNITFEVYGVPVVHETYGDVILHFTGKKTGGTGSPGTTVKEATHTPDGDKIPEGGKVVWVQARGATYATATIHYLDLTGKELGSKEFYKTQYRSFKGVTYTNPKKPEPTPGPTDDPAPTPDPGDGGDE